MTRLLMKAAAELCGGKIVMIHEGGYSESYVPYCGLAVLEEMSGVKTSIEDQWAPLMAKWGQQALEPHQAAAIARAEQLLDNIV
jgi:acetoin utilization deacetylase AcuC-like enzyme